MNRVFKDDTIIERPSIHVNCDPDRLDVYDLSDALGPVLVKIAYGQLVQERNKHKYADEPFPFTADALNEKAQELAMSLGKMLIALRESEFNQYVTEVQTSFPDPLTPSTAG